VANSNKVFFAGGEVSDGTVPTKAVDIYDAGTNTWSTAALSLAGSGITAAAVGSKVLFAGGEPGFSGTVNRFNRVDLYDLATNTWSTASLSEAKQGGHRAVTVNNKVYISGGQSSTDNFIGSTFISNTVNTYDNVTNTWSTTTMMERKSYHAAIAADNKIYWAGGYTDIYNNSSCVVEIMDLTTGSSSLQHLSSPGNPTAVRKDTKIIFYKGGSLIDKIDIYDTATNTWSIGVLPISLSGASIIAVNNTIYLAEGGSTKVWKLEF
jgi:N-acetylneuraminic acid mutarotase